LFSFRSFSTTAVLFTALGVLSTSHVARANGRYPLSQQLLVDPSDTKHLFLRSTYGVLTSSDGGASWFWMCESGIGYDPGEDPMMAILGDGSVLVGASEGLFATHDRGCTWPKDATIGDTYVRDLATESGGTAALATTVTVEQGGRYDAAVWRSADGAVTWKNLGTLSTGSVLPFTLDVAPSDAERVYVTTTVQSATRDAGVSDGPGILFVSKDGGVTWKEKPIPGTTRNNGPYIAAVHPTDPDVLYVRVRGEWDGTNPVQSWLLYSEDAGDTWKELFRANADMLGFALAPDTTTVLVGMGDTLDVLRPVDDSVLGLYRASGPAFTFSRLGTGEVGCLVYSGAALYVCGGEETDGYELGVSNDDGETVTPVFEYGMVRGPLACPPSTPQAMICASQWSTACRGLGDCPRVDAGTSSGAAGSATSSGCCGSATPRSSAPQIGTSQLTMLPGEGGAWAAGTAAVFGILRRLRRRRRKSQNRS
jgi:hypothetical protein